MRSRNQLGHGYFITFNHRKGIFTDEGLIQIVSLNVKDCSDPTIIDSRCSLASPILL